MHDHYPDPPDGDGMPRYLPEDLYPQLRKDRPMRDDVAVTITRRVVAGVWPTRTLLATAGQTMTVGQARAAGIPDDAWQPTNPNAAGAQAAAVPPVEDRPEPWTPDEDDPATEWPEHRGGPYWTLSDGSTFRGSRDGAAEAQAELDGDDAG
jgi:hypothetical protein